MLHPRASARPLHRRIQIWRLDQVIPAQLFLRFCKRSVKHLRLFVDCAKEVVAVAERGRRRLELISAPRRSQCFRISPVGCDSLLLLLGCHLAPPGLIGVKRQ